ncbi:unnamed protein product, partial [Natator depressus]
VLFGKATSSWRNTGSAYSQTQYPALYVGVYFGHHSQGAGQSGHEAAWLGWGYPGRVQESV